MFLSCVCASLRAPRAIIVVATPVPISSIVMAADEVAEDRRVDRLRRDRDGRARRDGDRRHADEMHDADAGGEQERRDELDVAAFVAGAADGEHAAGDAEHRAHRQQRRVPDDLAGDAAGSPWR